MVSIAQKICFFFLFLLFLPSLAQSQNKSEHSWPIAHIKISLVQNQLVLNVNMKKGYKTYWQLSGYGTYPPRVHTQNNQSVPILWPEPQRLNILGFETLGYKNSVSLPLILPPSTTSPLSLNVDVPVCDERQCFPLRTTLSAPSFKSLSPFKPKNPPNLTSSIPQLSLNQNNESFVLTASVYGHNTPPHDIFITTPEHTFLPTFPKPSFITTQNQEWIATSSITLSSPPPSPLPLSLFDPSSSLPSHSYAPTVENNQLPPSPPFVNPSFISSVLLAFIGGLLINLMPCVIPLIGIKFASLSPLTTQKKQRYFLFQSLGILTCFAFISAFFLLSFHLFNTPLWGQQLQSPTLITALAFFLSFFAFQIAGITSFKLPPALHNRLGTFINHHAPLQPFATGILIPLIATPCTAPFVASSLTAALLASSPLHGALIFLAIGTGIATPSLLIAAKPNISLFPSPKPQLIKLINIFMAALLLAFVAWLVSLTAALHSNALTITLSFSLITSAVLFILSRFKIKFLSSPAPFLALPILIIPPLLNSLSPPDHNTPSFNPAFNPATITAALQKQKPVFVSISAEWCLTCKINDAIINSKNVQKWLQKHHVVFIKADWTRPNPSIEQYLNQYNRYGIPFNALYLPSPPFPKNQSFRIFPSILTPQTLFSAIPSTPP